MILKRFALCCTILFAMFAGTFVSFKASAENQNFDRTPRTEGRRPDAWTRMELAAIVHRRAKEAGLPAELVSAVIGVESDWDQQLTGHAGEIGLMQIKPTTARELGFTGADEKLYDPDTNIRWGVRYLAEAYKSANGDLCHTVLKYQAGHQATRMTSAADAYCTRVRGLMAAAN